MLYLIAYILIALLVMQRTFITVVRHEIKEWGSIDTTDTVAFSLVAFLLGLVWPVTVLVYVIYRYILEPLVNKLNEEGK